MYTVYIARGTRTETIAEESDPELAELTVVRLANPQGEPVKTCNGQEWTLAEGWRIGIERSTEE